MIYQIIAKENVLCLCINGIFTSLDSVFKATVKITDRVIKNFIPNSLAVNK